MPNSRKIKSPPMRTRRVRANDTSAKRVARTAERVHDDLPVDVLPQPAPIPCRKHPRYGVLRRPTGDCRECWAMWLAKLAREQGLRPDTDDPSQMMPAEAACEDPFPPPVDDGEDEDADFGDTP